MEHRFEDVVRLVATERIPGADLEAALRQVGPRAHTALGLLERAERANLAERFVRSLRTQSVRDAVHLERQLLLKLDAAPQGAWSSDLESEVAFVELRNHLKQSLTALGLDWNHLTRVQSLVGGVARWLKSLGGATMDVTSTPSEIEFVLTAKDAQLTPELVRESPMVQMLRAQLTRFEVNKQSLTVEICFSIHRA